MGFSTVIPPSDQRQYLVVLDPCPNFPEGDFVVRSGKGLNFLAQHFEYARARGENWSWIDAIEAAKILRVGNGLAADPGIADKLKQAREVLKQIDELAEQNVKDAKALRAAIGEKVESIA